MLKIDNAYEYFASNLSKFLTEQGILHQSSCPYTPQQNSITKRKNRHIFEVSCSLIFTTNVPKFLWGEAILTATYLINQMPSRILQFKTHYDSLVHAFPTSHILHTIPFKVFGCSAYVQIHNHFRRKLYPKAFKCVFVRYSTSQKCYKCFYPVTRRFYNNMDVTFF